MILNINWLKKFDWIISNFGETSQWIITTPNMDELKEHEEDNNIEIDGGDLLETPDESILESINQTPSTLGVVSLIKQRIQNSKH